MWPCFFIAKLLHFDILCNNINGQLQKSAWFMLGDAAYWLGMGKRIFNIVVLYFYTKFWKKFVSAISQEPTHQFSKFLNQSASNDIPFIIWYYLEF